jgi:hypothetical protein
MKPKTELADRIMQRHMELVHQRAVWETLWEDIARYVMPRKAGLFTRESQPSVEDETVLHDGTAVRANMILANGQLAWMTPMESRWFSMDPPKEMESEDAVEQWFSRCTEVVQAELSRSNFYTEIHELYLDRGAFGTAAILVEAGRNSSLNFTKLDIGTFAVSENDEGYVDTLSREYEMTARQAALKFGAEALPEPMRKELDAAKSSRKYQIVHTIYPRGPGEIDFGKRDAGNKPYASVYVEKSTKHILLASGFDEQPFFVTRYLKWKNSECYGYSPSWTALPEARQLNFLEKQLDALAELTAFPRILIPAGFDGDIDLRAGGVTYFDPNNPNATPKEWGTQGRYDIGIARAEVKRNAINEAFHVDLFKMFAMLEKQMTAREVMERSAEKLIQFSPTFARMTTELFNPLLRRTFAILARQGKFPPPPQQLEMVGFIPEPEINYNSRVALAIKQLENAAFIRTSEMLLPYAQIKPEMLDNFDFDEITRDMARNDGLPARWLMDEEMVAQQRAARAQAQQQAMQAEQMERTAAALGKAGAVKQDSMLAGLLPGMAGMAAAA